MQLASQVFSRSSVFIRKCRVGLKICCSTLLVALLGGCLSTDEPEEAFSSEAGIAVIYADRKIGAIGDPVDPITFSPGGDLYIINVNAPDATQTNITKDLTLGEGDVADPEVSFDGKKVVFSMRRAEDITWNIWEYDIDSGEFRAVLIDDSGNDVDPAYLPDGRIVFASTRHGRTWDIMRSQNKEAYQFVDEYQRQRVTNLHVMNADGTDVQQISFNQSHDRNPTVLADGKIMFSRWEHVGDRNQFTLFTINPDGSNPFILYGAHSPGEAYLHPREMQDGRIVSSLMPLSGTFEGGAMVLIDIKGFSEFDTPDPNVEGLQARFAHQQVISNPSFDPGLSEDGRYTTPYPIWDGSHRLLVSWTPHNPVLRNNPDTGIEETVEATPRYGLFLVDTKKQTSRPIILSEVGRAMVDPIAILPREVPNVKNPVYRAEPIAAGETVTGLLNVFSVYDTDILGRMGDAVLAEGEVIPKLSAPQNDNRTQVADILTLKDPTKTTAAQRPARFFRITKAVESPVGYAFNLMGNTSYEMQQIVGYGVVHPDGSLQTEVPADQAIAISVLDAQGRAFQQHSNWLQVRPNETRSCNGCHSPRRGDALNNEEIRASHPGVNEAMQAQAPGETMAQTVSRVMPEINQLSSDLVFSDIWSSNAAEEAEPEILITYDELTTRAPRDGIINYPEHIQPLWTTPRGEEGIDTCINCHTTSNPETTGENGSQGLDLSGNIDATGFVLSYSQLVKVEQEGANASPGYVQPGLARGSYLVEKLYETELVAERALPIGEARLKDHSQLLNLSEKRLINEWIDLGAQYYNSPYIPGAGDDGVFAVSEIRQLSQGKVSTPNHLPKALHNQLIDQCGSCHKPHGKDASKLQRQLVLTGEITGDFNNLVRFINTAEPESSTLITIPTREGLGGKAVGHPSRQQDDGRAALNTSSEFYRKLIDWIQSL